MFTLTLSLRENLSELKMIIIDEMSLIEPDMLYKLDAKLKEIFQMRKNVPFGVLICELVLPFPFDANVGGCVFGVGRPCEKMFHSCTGARALLVDQL